jgi:two-component system NtrC family sensor kinase
MLHIATFFPRRTISMPLRRKLFLILSLMTMVPLLILLFGVVDRIESDLQQRIEAELHGKLDKMSSEINTLLAGQRAMAQGLAQVPAVKEFLRMARTQADDRYEERAAALQQFFLQYQQNVATIQAVRVIDANGKSILKVKEGHRIEPQYLDADYDRYFIADQSGRPFYKEAIDGFRDVYVSDFELGQVQRDAEFCPAMMRYSVPVRRGEDIDGVLVLNMWGSRIDETVLASIGGFPGKVYIAEISQDPVRDGIYLFHQDSAQRFANQLGTNFRISKDIGTENWQNLRNTSQPGMLSFDDGRMLFYHRYEPYQDERASWLIVIEASRDSIFAPINEIRFTIWLLLGVVLLLSLFVARWAADRLASPVQALASTITRYADGAMNARYTDTRSDEIGVVGRAFNYLCETLERTRRERDKAESAVRQSERLAAVGQMAAGIGHEINNPLMNIMSLASLVEKSLDPEKDKELLQDIHTLQGEGQRCARIVQGILKFARASEPRIERFDMASLLRDTLALLKHRIDATSLHLKKNICQQLYMQGDPNQLQQVIVNILLNAIQASPVNSKLSVSLEESDGNARVVVQDHGQGIPADELSRVFNPFYTTKPEGEGTGLGLSVSYGIVQKHGGQISIDSADGKGTTVVIMLPVDMVMPVDSSARMGVEENREKMVASN